MLQRRGVARTFRALAVDGRSSLSETRYVATAPSPSRSPEAATPASGAHSQPAAEINVLTAHDDFLLELGQIAHGRAAILPVD